MRSSWKLDLGLRRRDGRALVRRWCVLLGLTCAVCLAGPAASAFGAVVGVERVAATSASNSANKSVSVNCPTGKKLVGAGGFVDPALGQVLLDGVVPNSGLTGVTVEGVEDETGNADSWRVAVIAACATPPAALKRVAATSAVSSANKSVTASCPAGKRLLGLGGETGGGAGQVLLSAIRPNAGLTAAIVSGVEDENGFAGSWSVTAYAICATAPTGLELVSATSPSDSTGKSAIASCPAGRKLLGAGGEISGGAGQTVMDVVSPSPFNELHAGANGTEDETGFAGNWSVTAYAICANASQRVVARSANDSSASKFAQASCPVWEWSPTGGGGDITGGLGQVGLANISPGFDVPPRTLFAMGFEDENGFGGDWSVRAYAICATALPGLERRGSLTEASSASSRTATVSCPAGKKVVGAGGEIHDYHGLRQVLLEDIRPNTALTKVTVTGFEDETGTDGLWAVEAVAMCATPPPGLQLVAAGSEADSDPASVTATCPSGKNLLGTGGEISEGFGQVVLDDMRPNAGLTNTTVTALEDETGFAGDWSATAYAICANA